MSVESGWYPDPGNSDSVRWWTGAEWTGYALPSFAFPLPEVPEAPALQVTAAAAPEEPAAPQLEPFTDGPIRVAPPAPEKRRRAPAAPRQPVAPTAPARIVEALPKQATSEPLTAPSTVTLLPGADVDPPPAQQRRRLRRSK